MALAKPVKIQKQLKTRLERLEELMRAKKLREAESAKRALEAMAYLTRVFRKEGIM